MNECGRTPNPTLTHPNPLPNPPSPTNQSPTTQQVRARLRRTHAAAVDAAVEERLLAALVGEHASPESRESFRALYREGLLDEREVELDLPPPPARPPPGAGGNDPSLQEMVIRVDRLFGARGAGRGERRRLTIAEARGAVAEAEAEKLAPADVVAREAVAAAESDGIVFIDEIDKVCLLGVMGWFGCWDWVLVVCLCVWVTGRLGRGRFSELFYCFVTYFIHFIITRLLNPSL